MSSARCADASGMRTILIAPFGTPLGTNFGWDFNPTVDRIRLHSDLDQNLRVNPPNNGSLLTIGALGTTTTLDVGFDIAGNNGTAYVTLTAAAAGPSTLHVINLANGSLFPIGTVANALPLRGIAVSP